MAPRKPKKDPNAPKRNLSAYMLFQNAMGDLYREQHPELSFGQLAKFTSERYAELPANEKAGWKARAEADRARYLHELAHYTPPPGYDSKGDSVHSYNRPHYRQLPCRDANAPRRHMSAYQLYCNALREHMRREKPKLPFGKVAKYTWQMYRALSPEEKSTWDARAHQDKTRFDAEMSVYVPPPGHDKDGNLLDMYKHGQVTMVPLSLGVAGMAAAAAAAAAPSPSPPTPAAPAPAPALPDTALPPPLTAAHQHHVAQPHDVHVDIMATKTENDSTDDLDTDTAQMFAI